MLCNSSLAGVCDLLDTCLAFWLRPRGPGTGPVCHPPSLLFQVLSSPSFHSAARSGPSRYATNPHFFIQSPSRCSTIGSSSLALKSNKSPLTLRQPLFHFFFFCRSKLPPPPPHPPDQSNQQDVPVVRGPRLSRCNLGPQRMEAITVRTVPTLRFDGLKRLNHSLVCRARDSVLN